VVLRDPVALSDTLDKFLSSRGYEGTFTHGDVHTDVEDAVTDVEDGAAAAAAIAVTGSLLDYSEDEEEVNWSD
jgi:hypothetical protein